jgi:hypothetical protein
MLKIHRQAQHKRTAVLHGAPIAVSFNNGPCISLLCLQCGAECEAKELEPSSRSASLWCETLCTM